MTINYLEACLAEQNKSEHVWHVSRNKPAAQAAGQTLPDATPSVGKNHQFSKIAVTFEPIQRLRCPSRFRFPEHI